jgi:membrane-associated phospholipid phosphatase
MGAAFASYAIGRALHKPCVARVGAALFRAQLIAQGLTLALKETSRRSRPAGGGFSFPSGHTAMSFASATVLQQEFGWKVGIPAYAVASYVAASRVQMKRHYLSDVTFGAALGIVAGRTVSIGHGRRLLVTPIATPSGAAAGFTILGKR